MTTSIAAEPKVRILAVAAQAFRGVPTDFNIAFPRGTSCVLLGDNGTGKSTIADAVEWYFTDQVAALRHEGRQYAIRHIAAAADQATTVQIEATEGESGKIALSGSVSTREMSTPPNDNPELEHGDIWSGETFLLRGGTLAAFVQLPKGDKWKVVSEILGLEEVDSLRLDLQQAKNDLGREATNLREDKARLQETLRVRTTDTSDPGILRAIQRACREADVPRPGSIDEVLRLDWEASLSAHQEAGLRTAKLASADAELRAARPSTAMPDAVGEWNSAINEGLASERQKTSLMQAGRSLIETAGGPGEVTLCPLCNQPVDADSLLARIIQTLADLDEAAQRHEQLVGRLDEVRHILDQHADEACRWIEDLGAAGIEVEPYPTSPSTTLSDAIQHLRQIDVTVWSRHSAARAEWLRRAVEVTAASTVGAAISKQRAALLALGELRNLVSEYRSCQSRLVSAEWAASLAEQVFAEYQARQRAQFASTLSEVSEEVARIYSRLHPDEDLRGVALEPWRDKGLELALDFHGVRQRPPHGVLSESHLNSLGLALFLAMATTFNEYVNVLILDDVVNSFDAEHRGAVAQLLADEFETWQVIVLTHDAQFYEHLRKRAPRWQALELAAWEFEVGPRWSRYGSAGTLAQARGRLPDDVNGAGQKGRQALEDFLRELCENLEALVIFRRGVANDLREPSELLSAARGRLKKRMNPMPAELEKLLTDLDADLGAVLNPASHSGRGRPSPQEMVAALDRVSTLEGYWTCSSCGTRAWHVREPGSSHCRCAQLRF